MLKLVFNYDILLRSDDVGNYQNKDYYTLYIGQSRLYISETYMKWTYSILLWSSVITTPVIKDISTHTHKHTNKHTITISFLLSPSIGMFVQCLYRHILISVIEMT